MGTSESNDAASETAVKYHLVEAEEVETDPTPQRVPRGAGKTKRKGKLQWSHFPLEESLKQEGTWTPEREDSAHWMHKKATGHKTGKGALHEQVCRSGRGSRSGGRVGGRRPYYSHYDPGYFYDGMYVPPPDVNVTAQWAKSQIEFYFTSDNLVRDIFLRQHMDVDGYVPLAFVGSFQAVYSVHQDYASLFEAMKHSETLELDEQNETIRLRHGWEKWVWPNGEGGYGVPRYIKQQTDKARMA